MIKSLIHVTYISLILFASHTYGANEQLTYYKATKHVPLEIALIYSSIYKNAANNQQIEKINNISKQLNLSFSLLSKEELFFISKTEIYKSILSEKILDQDMLSNLKIDNDTLAQRVTFYTTSKLLTPFASWIVTSIFSDYNIISKGTSKNKTSIKKMLTPWIYYIFTIDPTSFNKICQDKAIQSLLVINNLSKILITMSKFEKKADIKKMKTNISYFTLESFSKTDNKESEALNKFLQEDSSKYIPPNQLPMPVDSWDIPISNEIPTMFPTPNPSYIPPSELPTPVTSW